MKPIPSLTGKSRWLTAPSTAAVVAGVAVAGAYLLSSVDLPEGTRLPLVVILAVVAVIFNVLGDLVEQERLRPLSELAKGSIPASQRNLVEAAKVVLQAPDVTFVVVLIFVIGGAVLTAFIWMLWTQASTTLALRIGLVGLTVAPVSAVLGNLVILPRERAVLRLLLELKLDARLLLAARPVRFELGRRFMIYAAVTVVSPLLLVGDLSLARAAALERALTASPTDAAALLASAGSLSSLGPVFLLGTLVLALVAGSAWLAGSSIGGPLAELAAHTERLAQGDYSVSRVVASEHETLSATLSITLLQASLDTLAGRLDEASKGIGARAAELVSGVERQESGATQQSAALAETTATTEELARSAKQIAANASKVAELARRGLDSATAGKNAATAFAGSMRQVREGHQAIADAVVRLNKRVQQVSRIIGFIDGIADRSDLLALNAELEGNKAGEVGRGFSLVAAEMRRLAESVMGSTKEIGRLLDDIRDATNAAVMATEAGVKASDLGANLAQAASGALDRIVDFSRQTSDAMQAVNQATLQQQAGTDQLVQAMAGILLTTRGGLDTSKEIAHANERLVSLSADLTSAVARLRRTE